MKKFYLFIKLCLVMPVLLLVHQVQAQNTVTGKVTSQDEGSGLPGVNVIIKGTSSGTTTDLNGTYRLEVPAEAVLIFSYVGYLSEEVNVGNRSVIDLAMSPDISQLEEIVVVGYGTQKKSDITGSVASFDNDRLNDYPQVNVTQALQGTIAGLTVSNNSNSAEGSDNTIRIRGRRSISADSDPLLIVDGVPFSSPLSEIHPNDIASIEVLKDASSSAIYGARAANGVILITTKKGARGKKVQINYSGYYGVEEIASLPDMMDAETYWMRKTNRFDEAYMTDSEVEVYESGEYPDWIKLALRTGQRQQHSLSVSGGTDDISYYFSGTYDNVQGIAKNDDFNRFNLRMNLNYNVTNWLAIGTNTTLGHFDRSGDPANFTDAFQLNPLTKVYEDDGETLTIYPWVDDNFFQNPLAPTLYDNDDKTWSIISNNFAEVTFPVEGLKYRLNTGITSRSRLDQTYRARNTKNGYENNGSATINNQLTTDWLVENILSYERSFGKHNLFLTGLYSAQEYSRKNSITDGVGFPNDVMSFYGIGNAEVLSADNNYTKHTHNSQMLRVNYNYNSRYLLTATARRDGYSAFGEDKKYGLFPSLALGWNIGNELFMSGAKFLSDLKLRASYGSNGNEAVSPYSTLARLSQADYVDPNGRKLVGYYPGRLSNPLLGWEETQQFNLGIDFGFFKSRLQGSLDMYKSKTTDLLLSKSIPSTNGTTSILENIGETSGKGFEIQLSSINIHRNNFKWTSDLVVDVNRNEIVHVGITDEMGNYIDDIGSRWFIGQPIEVNYGYEITGNWQLSDTADVNFANYSATGPGHVRYRDVDGNDTINTDDRILIGSRIPKYTLGLTNTFKYKNFSFSFFVYAVQGVTRSNSLYTTNDWDLRYRVYNFNYWTEDNPTNDYPRNHRDNNVLSASFYEDASFLRLQDVTFSYQLPQNVLDRIHLKSLQIYINAKNLATITKWRGLDPEFSDQTNRPLTKLYLIGARIGL